MKMIIMSLSRIYNIVGVEEGNILPANYDLSQNYPNPFNPETVISFQIPSVELQHSVSVQFIIYDALENEIATIINEEKYPGKYQITFNGSSLTSGVYFYRIIAGSFVDTKKMLLLK